MTPRHHPPEELLLGYASGASAEAVSLIVGTHLVWCAACRARVQALEAIGGLMLDTLDAAEVSPAARDALFARLDAPAPAPAAAEAAPDLGVALPRVVHPYVRGRAWKWLAPGVHALELGVRFQGQPAVLTRLRPGLVVPPHTHRGHELQLVLQGGYRDDFGEYDVGDLQFADDEHRHSLTIDPGPDCVTLLVREARIVNLDWKGALFSWFTGA